VSDHAVIGYVHGGTVRAEFAASLLAVAMEGCDHELDDSREKH
jgi:hypothetical protein